MNDYSKANLFVDKYRTGPFGRVGSHIGLPDATVRVLRGVELEDGWHSDPNGELWLMVEHGDFWPVMVRLDDDDVTTLRAAIFDNVHWTYTSSNVTNVWPDGTLKRHGQTLS